MEVFQASWKEESLSFQKEDFYETIRAPKWIDFTAPDSAEESDDRAWFCIQAGCDQKHETVLEPTSHNSYLLKFQESKSVNHNMTRLSPMENKSGTKARRASLSAPTLKGKDKTPGKVKPYFMSAGKIRQKQCLENENPNSTPENNIANLDLKLKIDVPDDAKGFSTPKQLSNRGADMEASQNSPPDDFTGTVMDAAAIHSNPKHGKNRITKPMGAFSTPRIKKCSVKPEPFRSVQSSKGSNAATSMNSTRSRTTAVKSILFQTPTKVLAKPPSKDLTSLTEVCADLKKLDISGEINHVQGHFCRSSRCAANDPNYSSPASVPPKKYLSARSLLPNQTSESPLLKSHTKSKGDGPSSSKPKDPKSVPRHPPSSHRRALFSEQDIENENLPKASAQTLDLKQNKVEISTENDSSETQVQYLSEKSNLEGKFQTFQINVSVPLKGEERHDSKLATEDVEISGFDVLGHDLKNRDRSFYIKDIPEEGRLMKNPMSINHEQTGTNGQKPVESESEGKENNLLETDECESGVEEQIAICEKDRRLRVNESEEAKNSDPEKPISEQDETDMSNVLERLQQCFESLKEGRSGMKINSEEVEIAFCEDRHNDAQSDFHWELVKTNIEERVSEALVDSDAEDKAAVDETAIEVQLVSEAKCEASDVERKAEEILKTEFYSERDNRIVERPNEFLPGSNGAIFCLDIGPERNEISSIPQSECNETSHCLVSKSLNSEVDSDMGSDHHEKLQIHQSKAHNKIKYVDMNYAYYLGSEETSSKRISSDTLLQDKVVVCTVNIAADTTADRGSIPGLDSESCTTANCIRTPRHEEMGSEDPSQSPDHDEHMGSESGERDFFSESGERDFFTSAKGKKRSSCDMNSKINCSKGELCQDEGCQSSGKVNSNSLAAQTSQDNGMSVLHVGKHKKPKTTCPNPFRLRTEERRVFKEANLNKKRDESIADKGSLTVFLVPSTSVNKTRHKGKYPRLEPSKVKPKKVKSEAVMQTKSLKLDKDKTNKVKPKQIEIPKSVKAGHLEDNEEGKNALVKTVHQPIKMPFFGQPFTPQRSTKKLTIPREPNFHPIHPKKDCTKGTSDSGHCKKEWID